jgi:hypothetical protein
LLFARARLSCCLYMLCAMCCPSVYARALASPAVRASVPCYYTHEDEPLSIAVFSRHLKRRFLDAKEYSRRTRCLYAQRCSYHSKTNVLYREYAEAPIFALSSHDHCEFCATLQAEMDRVSLSGEYGDRTLVTTQETLPTCRRGHRMQHSWCTVSILDDLPQTSYGGP